MHDAQLDFSPREHALDCVGEARQPVDARDQDVFDAAALEFGEHSQPELGALRFADPQAKKLFVAF